MVLCLGRYLATEFDSGLVQNDREIEEREMGGSRWRSNINLLKFPETREDDDDRGGATYVRNSLPAAHNQGEKLPGGFLKTLQSGLLMTL